jgi:hypothetical protein
MPERPPALIIHGLAHARLALAPGLPVTLLSAPNAAAYAGCLWWQQVLAQAGFAGPAFLDCGQATGRALEALKLGLTGIILHHPPAIIRQIAAAQGALVLPEAPPALDLATPGAARRLALWLTQN